MLDPKLMLGAELPEQEFSWTERDVILYALSVGVGANGIDPTQLRRLYEHNLEVLPTFGALGSMLDVNELGALPGAGFDPVQVLHGAHEIDLHRNLPASVTNARRSGRVIGVHDKGSASVVVVQTCMDLDGDPLVTSRITCVIKGEGGHGFAGGVEPTRDIAPSDREPDDKSIFRTLGTQAALYRLCGDLNPLHIDPEVAAGAGFDRPILHGLCTFGIAATAVIDALLNGDGKAVRRLRVRFSGVAFPGDVLETRAWRVDDGIVYETVAANRDGAPVLSGAALIGAEERS